ncbi:MAG: TIGR00730 family Rossman fold protein [Patescibacteria group bacterium]
MVKKVVKTSDLIQVEKPTFAQYHEPIDYRDTWRIFRIMAEFVDGYQFLGQFKRTITFFGSARLKPETDSYKQADRTGYLLGKAGFSIITGGGPGIMEAGNKGASEAGAESIGLNIQLPNEQVVNKYVKKSLGFHYFFSRKVMLTSPAQAGVFFPGGFGTLDEFFEILDLIETNKIKKIPVVAVGREFWAPLIEFLKSGSLKAVGAIAEKDLEIFQVVDTAEEASEIIKKSPIKKNLCDPAEENCGKSMQWRIFRIMAELVDGFEFLSREISRHDDVTVLGTKSVKEDNPFYIAAYEMAKKLGRKRYTIITGGGPGIMEAANKGAVESNTASLGIDMNVNNEVRRNPYVRKSISFSFPFTRKLIITMPSLAFIFFPGGYGTLHQLFEVLTLMQTGKIENMKVILYGKKFWAPLDAFIKNYLNQKYQTISPKDIGLYQIVDSVDEAVAAVPPFHSHPPKK